MKALLRDLLQRKTKNTTRCNNHDDLLNLDFTLKIPIFSEACIQPIRTSMMELLF